jgi:hypothetical protein
MGLLLVVIAPSCYELSFMHIQTSKTAYKSRCWLFIICFAHCGPTFAVHAYKLLSDCFCDTYWPLYVVVVNANVSIDTSL